MIRHEREEEAIHVIESGVDVNILDHGESPMHAALFTGQVNVFRLLVE